MQELLNELRAFRAETKTAISDLRSDIAALDRRVSEVEGRLTRVEGNLSDFRIVVERRFACVESSLNTFRGVVDERHARVEARRLLGEQAGPKFVAHGLPESKDPDFFAKDTGRQEEQKEK